VRAIITKIMPTLDDDDSYELVFLKLGLSEEKMVGLPKGQYSVGDEINVNHQFLRSDADALLHRMTSELCSNGAFEKTEVACDELGKRYEPTNYLPDQSLDGTAKSYLVRIFALMKELGRFNIAPTHDFYFLDFPEDEVSLQGLVELGFLISEYQWKSKHENAASANYTASENRLNGVKSAAESRRLRGRETCNTVESFALEILEFEPELRNSNTRLAKAVLKAADQDALEYGGESLLPIKLQHVRKIIAKLKRQNNI
jgi:hypothetical protein